ncbi:MAG: hypothetical protein EXS09_22610 [Gemmataceae bacterium]|nr:hypothetical protein [Gemmataceae bacterium]
MFEIVPWVHGVTRAGSKWPLSSGTEFDAAEDEGQIGGRDFDAVGGSLAELEGAAFVLIAV